jgi:hypothetical protein
MGGQRAQLQPQDDVGARDDVIASATPSSTPAGPLLSVAVDNTQCDDDGHAEKRANCQHQPAVLELTCDDAAQEYGTRSIRLTAAASAVASRTISCRSSAAGRNDRCSLD